MLSGCEKEGMLHKNIENKPTCMEVCPEAVVDCPLKEMGCSEDQLKRKDIQSPTTNCCVNHLALLMKIIVENNRTKQAMQKQADACPSE